MIVTTEGSFVVLAQEGNVSSLEQNTSIGGPLYQGSRLWGRGKSIYPEEKRAGKAELFLIEEKGSNKGGGDFFGTFIIHEDYYRRTVTS